MTTDRRVIVCYDVADDYRRNHVSRTLLDYGTRIQQSVFECILSQDLHDEMVERVKRLTASYPEDRVCFVDLCATCGEKITVVGSSPRADQVKSMIV